MTKTDEVAIEREIQAMHSEYLERRAERDTQAMIRLANLAYYTAFEIAYGVGGAK